MRKKWTLRYAPWFLLVFFVQSTAAGQDAGNSVRAFPGAEGFGAYTIGGRGGSVYIVTSLEDYDFDEEAIPGSLRRAVEAQAHAEVAQRGYQGILKEFISVEDGLVSLNSICSVAGLGGPQQRDGSFAYYMSEPISSNDAKGVGPFIMASIEVERLIETQR